MTAPPALALRGIQKRFGSVQALRGADFTLVPGELHALLGENGAGKTTLMHVAYGLARPDAGTVAIAGAVRSVPSPRAARRLGVGMVHQHFTSVPALTRGGERGARGRLAGAPAALRERVRALAERSGFRSIRTRLPAGCRSALKQRLEIVKALAADARILLLDEPTAVLAPGEAEELLRVVRRFTARAERRCSSPTSSTRRWRAADRVTVLRQGAVVLRGRGRRSRRAESLAAAMIGVTRERTRRSAGPRAASRSPAPDPPVLVRLEELEVPRETGYGIAVRRATLAMRAGEIVGIAAVEGNGQRELLRAVAGPAAPAPRPARGGGAGGVHSGGPDHRGTDPRR